MANAKRSELTEKQYKCIEMLVNGENVTDIAIAIKVNRSTIYDWQKNQMFKDELDRCRQKVKNVVEDEITKNIKPLMNRIIKIALTSSADKTALDACIYAVNRLCGTPTNKTQDITTTSRGDDKPSDINTLIQEIQDAATEQAANLPKAN